MSDTPPPPEVSVVVVCYNERAHISACLDSLARQESFRGSYEVIVVDGDSTDGTPEIVRGHAARYPSTRLVVEPRRGTAVARNTGVREARAPLIAFLDADCVAAPEWLASLTAAFRGAREKEPRVSAVGGPSLIPEGSAPFVEALKIALDTWLGSGGRVTGMCHPRERFVADLPSLNVIYERRLFDEIGFFNDGLRDEGEDADFSYRILTSGRKLLYSPLPVVYHRYRSTPRSWWNNMRRYGRARGVLLVGDPAMLNLHYLGPLLLVAGLAFSPLGFLWRPLFLPLAYGPVVFAAACAACIRARRPALIPLAALAFCLTHLGYGAGEFEGVAKALARRLGGIGRSGK